MVFTLHRYIFRELMKVFVLAAVALTLMVGLGSVLRPVQEYGVGPRQVIGLIGYFLPITLTFVLPMAALFSAALVYGRFASDNELDACRASGISLVTLVYPGLVLAIIVAIANLILSFYVMPDFVHRAEKSFKSDAKQILFRNIQRKGSYKLPPDGRYRIYADLADAGNNILSGVIVIEAEGYKIKRIISSESAKINFIPHENFNEVQITAYNTYQMGSGDEGWFYFEWLPIRAEFGSLMGDDIRFKKIDEMKRIRTNPMNFYPIEKLARKLYAQFTAELLAEDISSHIESRRQASSGDPNSYYELVGEPNGVKFTAGACKVRNEKELQLLEVTAVEYDAASKETVCRLQCTKAYLHIEGDELAPTLTMEMYNPSWTRPDGSEGLAARRIIRGLLVPKSVTDKFISQDVLETIKPQSIASALGKQPSPILNEMQSKLNRKIQRTLVKIRAEIHSRLAFGVGCVPLIMIGIGLGIILKGGHLLSAFGASAVPAVVLIVCIMSGFQLAENPAANPLSGIILIWTGLALLLAMALVVYRKLLKN